MASIMKYKNKGYRVQIRKNGVVKSKIFDKKSEASKWALQTELELDLIKNSDYKNITLADLMHKYLNEYSSKKASYNCERKRLNFLIKNFDFVNRKFSTLTRYDFLNYIEIRLQTIKPSSLRRELTILKHLIKIAIEVWELIPPNNFLKNLNLPPEHKRTQRWSDDDINKIKFIANLDLESNTRFNKIQLVAITSLIAIETGMRAGEILKINLENLNLEKRIFFITTSKNGDARTIPLSQNVIKILKIVIKNNEVKNYLFDGINSDMHCTLFRKLKNKANLSHLTFHDTRREGLTRLSNKVDVLTLCKISGHRDINILQSTYYAPKMDEIAKLLDRKTADI